MSIAFKGFAVKAECGSIIDYTTRETEAFAKEAWCQRATFDDVHRNWAFWESLGVKCVPIRFQEVIL